MPKTLTYEEYVISAAGATKSFDVDNSPTDIYEITTTAGGPITLLANMIFNSTGTPVRGMEFIFDYKGQVTIGAFNVQFFGVNLTAAQALYESYIYVYYNGATWEVTILSDMTSGKVQLNGANIVDGTIASAALAGNVAITKLAALVARGYMVRGGVNGVFEGFNAVTSGNFVAGNGSDVGSYPMTGDVTVAYSGGNLVASIGNGKVTEEMLAFTPEIYYQASLTIPTAQVLTLFGTPQTIVAAPGVGKYIEVVSASACMTFVSAAYATNTTMRLICAGASVAQLQDTAILLSTVTKNTKFKDVTSATAGQTQCIANAALQVDVATGNPITGDSDITVKVIYRIVTI